MLCGQNVVSACLSTSSTPEKQTDMILNLATTDAADTKIGDQSI
jgi:hypothetical protein